jgi:predicted  nucleic acid-binding Zn-ribbon protein
LKLKAEPTTQLRLLDLQAIDSHLDQLERRRRNLPQLARIAELSAMKSELADRLVLIQTQVDDLSREQRKADADVEQVKSRRSRDQVRLDSGQVGSPKELEGLQHEVVSLNRRISELEDLELEVMEQLETAQATLTEVRAASVAVESELATETDSRDVATAQIDAEIAEGQSERATTAGDIPADLLKAYDKLRRQSGGVGAAALQQKRCGGCSLEINPADLASMITAPANEVVRCEECGRILVRAPVSGI